METYREWIYKQKRQIYIVYFALQSRQQKDIQTPPPVPCPADNSARPRSYTIQIRYPIRIIRSTSGHFVVKNLPGSFVMAVYQQLAPNDLRFRYFTSQDSISAYPLPRTVDPAPNAPSPRH